MSSVAQHHLKIFWTTVGVIALGYFCYLISDVLSPFIVGAVLAYLLNPLVDKISTYGLSRGKIAALVTACAVILFMVGIWFLAPLLYQQSYMLAEELPKLISRLQHQIAPHIERYSHMVGQQPISIQEHMKEVQQVVGKTMVQIVKQLWQSSMALVNILSFLLITPLITFYMTRDWHLMLTTIDTYLPKRFAPLIREQVKLIDFTIAAYMRGQMNVCMILACYYALALTMLKLKFGFIIGFLTGILSFIPFIGFALGAGISLIIAFFQYDHWSMVAAIAAIFVIGQVVEGNFLTPRLIGEKIGLHPVWVVFGMLCGATLFGFVGVLLAIPLTAIVGVLIRCALSFYLHSEHYTTHYTLDK